MSSSTLRDEFAAPKDTDRGRRTLRWASSAESSEDSAEGEGDESEAFGVNARGLLSAASRADTGARPIAFPLEPEENDGEEMEEGEEGEESNNE